MEKINAAPADLMKQAGDTANTYLAAAIEQIDAQLGKGFAKKNPDLIGVFMRTCAEDMKTAVLASVIQDMDEHLRESLQHIAWQRSDA